MKIYRVEHKKTHVGPYNHKYNNRNRSILLNELEFAESLPTPPEDGICVKMTETSLSGFVTVYGVFKWFNHALLDLIRIGFVIAEYYVNDDSVWAGCRQVVFDSRCAKRVGEVDIKHFLKYFSLARSRR